MQARNGGVIAMRAETVGPTIKHFSAFDGDVACSGWRCRSAGCNGGCCNGVDSGCGSTDNVVSSVKSGVARCESANAFLVAKLKLGAE